MRISTWMMSSALLVLANGATAASSPANCPASISASETISSAVAPWQIVADESKGGRTLEQILVYTGHPRDMGSLAPDSSVKRNGKLVSTWLLTAPDARGGHWLGCAYRNSTTLLARPLPASTKVCRLTQRVLASGATAGIDGFECE